MSFKGPERVSNIVISDEFIDPEYGHVASPGYLVYYCDRERKAFLEDRGMTLSMLREVHGLMIVVAEHPAPRYMGSVLPGEEVEVHTQLISIDHFMEFDHFILKAGKEIFKATARLLLVREGGGVIHQMPKFLADRFSYAPRLPGF